MVAKSSRPYHSKRSLVGGLGLLVPDRSPQELSIQMPAPKKIQISCLHIQKFCMTFFLPYLLSRPYFLFQALFAQSGWAVWLLLHLLPSVFGFLTMSCSLGMNVFCPVIYLFPNITFFMAHFMFSFFKICSLTSAAKCNPSHPKLKHFCRGSAVTERARLLRSVPRTPGLVEWLLMKQVSLCEWIRMFLIFFKASMGVNSWYRYPNPG